MIDTKTIIIPEHRVEGKPLGRHVEHDAASQNYPYAVTKLRPLVSTHHERMIPILDQGDLGSCTGNAGTGLLGTEPFYGHLASLRGLKLDETYAVQLYSDATKVDGIAGVYPPNDTGSSGLAIGKVLKKRGLIASYKHAFGLSHALQALLDVPLITGIPWYSSFDHPDTDGTVHYDPSASMRGGHELEIVGMDVVNPDPTKPEGKIILPNSWGTGYGDAGYISMSFSDFNVLLERHGDVMTFGL